MQSIRLRSANLPNFAEYNGPDFDETIANVEYIKLIFSGLEKQNAWEKITFSTAQSIVNQLESLSMCWPALLEQPAQAQFEYLATTIDTLSGLLQSTGVATLAYGGLQWGSSIAKISDEIRALTVDREELGRLSENLKEFVTPSVARSLSDSFMNRKDSLYKGRLTWAVISAVLALISLGLTYLSIHEINESVAKLLTPHAKSSSIDSTTALWLSAALRTAILIPLYAGVGFSFSQYRKERDFEEEYAHKAAVAASLKNYGDLAKDEKVRDQIVTGATEVIFSSPLAKNLDMKSQATVAGSITEVLNSVTKLVSKSGNS